MRADSADDEAKSNRKCISSVRSEVVKDQHGGEDTWYVEPGRGRGGGGTRRRSDRHTGIICGASHRRPPVRAGIMSSRKTFTMSLDAYVHRSSKTSADMQSGGQVLRGLMRSYWLCDRCRDGCQYAASAVRWPSPIGTLIVLRYIIVNGGTGCVLSKV